MTRPKSQVALALGWLALIAALAPSPRTADEAGTLKALAESRAKVARQIADFYADPRLAALDGKVDSRGIPGMDAVEVWTRKFVEARLDASTGPDDRISILLEDLERTKAIEARLKALAENTPGFSKLDTIKAEFHRLDAEYRLAKEKAGK
jgi:hypothetical protein